MEAIQQLEKLIVFLILFVVRRTKTITGGIATQQSDDSLREDDCNVAFLLIDLPLIPNDPKICVISLTGELTAA